MRSAQLAELPIARLDDAAHQASKMHSPGSVAVMVDTSRALRTPHELLGLVQAVVAALPEDETGLDRMEDGRRSRQ